MLAALVCALALAPGASASLRTDGRRFVDSGGREVILRGGALIQKAAPGLPQLADADLANMRRLGWNSIRLGTSWRFIEPEPGIYDAAYLDAFAALARRAMDAGLHVIVDMHQDVWGPPVGNGAPEWTVYPECAPLHVTDLSKPTGTWAANYLSPWTFCQFTRFWEDRSLQRHFAGALVEIAERLGGEQRLAGYDLFNEPFQGLHPTGEFESRLLYPFYRRVARAVRRADPGGIVFEEPPNSKNVHLPTTPSLRPGRLAAYAAHVYGLWDASDAFSERTALVEANMRYSATEARAMRIPLWYGEFGMRRGAPGAEETLTQIYDIADRERAGTSYWEWGSDPYGPLLPDRSLDPVRALTLSRPYPQRTAGRLERFRFDARSGAFTMGWRGAGTSSVYVPELRYPAGYTVATDASWQAVAGTQLIEATAGAGRHRLTVSPR